MTEEQIQAEFWRRSWNEFPGLRRHMWAVPNGIHVNKIEAAKAKAMGLLPGVWDLHLFWRGQFHIIETKTETGRLTTDRIINGKKVFGQQQWGELMAEHGAIRHIYRSADEGIQMLRSIVGENL